jgi:XRE family transcriptional regulator, regulator of sulfur utilization
MEDIKVIVGANLKSIRKSRHLTLESLSSLTDVSISMLGEIERGDTNPTIAVLWKISNGLQIPFSELIKVDRPSVSVKRVADCDPGIQGDGYQIFSLFDYDPEKRFEVYYKTFLPGAGIVSNGHRDGIEEYVFVAEGCIIVSVGEDDYHLGDGDAMKFSGSIPHKYRNEGPGNGRMFQMMFYDDRGSRIRPGDEETGIQ